MSTARESLLMIEPDSKSGLPWYRYFWPWFIVALLSTSVVAAISTVVIAFVNQDSLVSEAWYENGTQINRRIESEKTALRRSIRAELRIDDVTGEVYLDLTGEDIGFVRELVLEFSHPTRASMDRSISLVRLGTGTFRGQLDAKLSGRWYASLAPRRGTPEPDSKASIAGTPSPAAWRISTTLTLPSSKPLVLDGSG
jgi:hypothetical protein